MPNYLVISEEYGEVVPILDYGQGPTEYGCDICYVIGAKNKNEARWTAYKHWKKQGYGSVDDDYKHPLKGMQVQDWPGESEYPIYNYTYQEPIELIDIETWEDFLKQDDVVVL